MQNIEIAWIFRELADLLEIKEEDFFKIRAYRNGARTIAHLDRSLSEYYRQGRIKDIPGIGKAMEKKIIEILETGRLKKHQDLLKEIPQGLLEIKNLPGISAKRAGIFYQRLGIRSLDDLEAAAKEMKIRQIPGMGAKLEWDILNNIDMVRNRRSRVLLSVARELAGELMEFLLALPEVARVELAGSTRRWKETVGDLDLVAAAAIPAVVVEAFIKHPKVKEIMEQQADRVQVLTWWGIAVDLQVVPEVEFITAWHRSTGSKAHYGALQKLAQANGLQLSHHGLYQDNRRLALTGEDDIYTRLGLNPIPPELREDRGELAAYVGTAPPPLLELSDIKGDLHLHTDWSDAAAPLADMVARAKAKGYHYMAVTDHSRSLKIANGLTIERLAEQHRLIDEMNRKNHDFRILKGTEMDILPNGELDFPDELLEKMDVVVASIHTAQRQDRETLTRRVLGAIENKHVDIIGHLTGRLLGRREAYPLDLEVVFEAAARTGTILEINASPDRLDLNEEHVRMAVDRGCKIVINTDAHDLHRLDEMAYGVAQARRARLKPTDVVNTLDTAELLQVLNK